MPYLAWFAIFCITAASTALADTEANKITTSGEGRYEKTTNYYLFTMGRSYSVRIPQVVSEGQTLLVSYDDGRSVKKDMFEVHRISNRDNLCRLHNRIVSRHDTYPGDIIYIRPCEVLE